MPNSRNSTRIQFVKSPPERRFAFIGVYPWVALLAIPLVALAAGAIGPDHRDVRACSVGRLIGCFALSGMEFARQTIRGSVFLLVLTLPALALNPGYEISQYAHSSWTQDKGIMAVRRIKQAPDGYLWLATRTGLVRFDGVRMTTFKAGSEQGLESSTIQDLLFDPDGTIWVATLGGGLAHYQGRKFHTYRAKDGLPSDDIGCIYRDSQGTLWVGTWGAGIARMVNGRFEKLPLCFGSQQTDTASFACKMESSRPSQSGMDFRKIASLPFTVTTPARSGQPVGKGSVSGMEPGSSLTRR
jgi:hypothetical protein